MSIHDIIQYVLLLLLCGIFLTLTYLLRDFIKLNREIMEQYFKDLDK